MQSKEEIPCRHKNNLWSVIIVFDDESNSQDKTATSASEIGVAFQKVGSTADSLKIPFEKVASYIATISAVTREAPETVGSAVKSILSRVESIKEKGYDETDGTKINQVSKALEAAKVQLVDANGQFKNFSGVLDELASKWSGLDDRTQRYIATTVAGTYQQSRFLALMNNYGQVLKLNDAALSASGTTQQKYDLYLQGTQAHIDRLKATMQGLWSDSFKSDSIKNVVDALTLLANAADVVVKNIGLVPVVLGAVGSSLALFNTKFREAVISTDLLSAAMKGVTVSLGMVRTAFTSLLASTGVGLLFAGIGFAVEKLIGYLSDLNEKSKESTTINYDHLNSLQQQKDGLAALSAEYETLSGKTNKTAEDKARLAQIEQDLVDKYGVATTGLDAQGKAYSDSTDLIKLRVNALNEEIQKENELNEAKLTAKDSSNNKEIADSMKQVEEAKKKLDEYETMLKHLQDLVNNQGAITNKNGEFGNLIPSVANVQSTADNYKDIIQGLREEISKEIAVYTNDYEVANAALQKPLDERTNILKNKTNQYITQLTESGTQISAQTKAFVLEIVKNVASERKNFTDEFDQMKAIIQSLGNTKITNSDDLKNFFNSFNLQSTNEQLDQFAKLLGIAQDKLNQVSASAINLTEINTQLESKFDNTVQAIRPLNDAIDELKKGHQLTSAAIMELVKNNPDLINSMKVENGQLVLNQKAIEDVRTAKINEMESTLSSQKAQVQAQEQALTAKLKAYGVEIDAINSVAEAQKAAQGAMEKVVQSGGGAMTPEMLSSLGDISQNLEPQMESIAKAKETIGALEKAASTNFDFKDKLNTGGGGNGHKGDTGSYTSPVGSGTQDTALAKEFIDAKKSEYEQIVKNNDALKQRASTAEQEKNYQSAIELTTQLIQGQTAAYNKLNEAKSEVSKEADSYRNDARYSALGNQFSKDGVKFDAWFTDLGGASEAYKNYIQGIEDADRKLVDGKTKLTESEKLQHESYSQQVKDAKDIFQSLSSLKQAYASYGDDQTKIQADINASTASIKKYKDEMDQLKVDDALKKMGDSTKDFESQIKSLKTAMDSLDTDPAGKVKDQNEIIDVYEQEQQQILANIKALQDLSSTLDMNSDAWNKAQEEIKKYQDQSAQVEADVYSIKEKVATQVVDLMKKAYEAEKQAQLDALDAEKQAYDDATQSKIDALDRLRAAQNYNDNLGKDQTKAQQIQNQINALSLDNSNEAKSKVLDLKQQLADQQDKITKEQQDYSDKLVKDDLENKKKAYDQDIQNQKDATTTKYDNLINDDKKWLAVEKDIIDGHIQGIQTEMTGLITNLQSYADSGMTQVKNNASQLLSLISQVKAASANLGQFGSAVNSPTAQNNSAIINGTTTDNVSWQDKLKRATTDDAYAISEILRAKSVYNADSATGNTVGAGAAHKYADQIRQANKRVGSNPLYMNTGGYTGDGEGLAYLHSKELVLNKLDTTNILKAVDYVRDIASRIKLPDFSNISARLGSAGGNSFCVNLGGITIQGTREGADLAINTIVNGMKRMGININ